MGDPAIKLFGKTIPLAEGGPGLDPDPIKEPAGDDKDMYKETANNEIKVTELDVPSEMEQGEHKGFSSLEDLKENELQTSSQDATEKLDSIPEQDQSETDASGQEKVLKKPDKILPCPRCNSLDTKFCYYNNYNVNQPRHFCKNCQRYWTAGGTMRNVPVGAGRRKNKHSASHYRHIMMSPEGLASTGEVIDSAHPCGSALGSLKRNGTVLKFGPEAPLCESMSSVLNLGEQKRTDFSTEEPSCASSVTASNCVENGLPENIVPKEQKGMPVFCNGLTPLHPLPYYPGPPWAYPWSAGWNNVAAAAAAAAAAAMAAGQCASELANGSATGNMSSLPWSTLPILTAPAFCAPTIPVPFAPASFWPTGGWSVPWAGSNGGLSPSSSTSNSGCSGNGSPTLGKHSRDSSLQGEEKTEKSLWIPKTLRIDDPDEAAKSSIWATLGINPDEGGMFKAFRSKSKGQGQKPDAPQALHANPAALSRSQSFQESM